MGNLTIEIVKDTFIFNKNGVCTNPLQVYFFMLKDDLAWRYIELKIACYQNKWSFGYSGPGCCGGANNAGEYYSKEEAVEAGIKFLRKCFKTENNVFGDATKHEEHFYNWVASRRQLSLF